MAGWQWPRWPPRSLGIVLAAPIAWFNLRGIWPGHPIRTRGGTGEPRRATVRHGFVVAQIALAFVLLTGTGLLGLSLQRAMDVSPGFRSDHVLTGQISLAGKRYPSARTGLAFTERLVGELGRQPGVLSVGIANNIPLSGTNGKSAATVVGHVLRPGNRPADTTPMALAATTSARWASHCGKDGF